MQFTLGDVRQHHWSEAERYRAIAENWRQAARLASGLRATSFEACALAADALAGQHAAFADACDQHLSKAA